jgi:hypothetical protein
MTTTEPTTPSIDIDQDDLLGHIPLLVSGQVCRIREGGK